MRLVKIYANTSFFFIFKAKLNMKFELGCKPVGKDSDIILKYKLDVYRNSYFD